MKRNNFALGAYTMKFRDYINERAMSGGNFDKYIRELSKKKPDEAKKLLKSNWMKLSSILKNNQLEADAIAIINKHFQSNYRSLDQIDKSDVAKLPNRSVYEDILNEDFKHYWDLIKTEGFPVLAFFPCLQAWLEIDKLIRGTGGDFKVMGIYALIWAFLVSGKFIKGWQKWKKDRPEEFEAEGARKNPFAVKK
jgi:hypothetical protein